MGSRNVAVGRAGERAAAEYFAQCGYRILAQNVRNRCGEIDLITVADDGSLVIVEVKTRSNRTYGAAEAVTPRKFASMRKAAARWLLDSTDFYAAVRFDVLVVLRTPVGVKFEHYMGVEHGAW